MDGTKPVIKVDQLCVTYGTFSAVKQTSLCVQPGETYALLGTNGAGKTSVLEVIEGHRAPSSGTVQVFGHDSNIRRDTRPRMGIMLQESSFAPDLTVAESLNLVGNLSQRSDDVEQLLEVVALSPKRDIKTAQLSGGEKRRLDFASAIFGSPELIFLDEPTTGLDIGSRDSMWNTISELKRNRSTVMLTTHYLEEAQQYADRIGIMHNGQIQVEGSVSELTRSLPATITFKLEDDSLPPNGAVRRGQDRESGWIIETGNLQRDLGFLLHWANSSSVQLDDLRANPTTLDDIFRSLNQHDSHSRNL